MKKLVCAGLAGAMLLGLSACTFTKNPPATDPTETETSETETSESVGIIDIRETGVYSVEGKTAEELVAQAKSLAVVSPNTIKDFSDRFEVLPSYENGLLFRFTTDKAAVNSIDSVQLSGVKENMDGSYKINVDGTLKILYVFADYETASATYEAFFADLTSDSVKTDMDLTTNSQDGTTWNARVAYQKVEIAGEDDISCGDYECSEIHKDDVVETHYYYTPVYLLQLTKLDDGTYQLSVEIPLMVEETAPAESSAEDSEDAPGAIPEISSGSAAVETSAGIEIDPEGNKTVLPIET